ncbi:MAG TPA: hypothetical protein GXX46_05850 [Peptococcaceae bacterium]|nr:hypothetical protein [Peptococcaceae bacterium]
MSILLPFSIIIILAILAFWGYRVKSKGKKPLLPRTAQRSLFPIYCLLLFLASVVVYALPDESFVHPPAGNIKEISAEIYQLAGRIWPVNTPNQAIYENLSESYPLTAKELKLVVAGDYQDMIWIERQEANQGQIQVKSYVTSYLVEDYDITSQIKPPVLTWEDNTLLIKSPPKYTLKFVSFKNNFLTSQFKNPAGSKIGRTYFGKEAIHLVVPSETEVLTDYRNIVYLN